MIVKLADIWDSYLDRFRIEEKDVYYTESYVKLYENLNDKALCLIVEDAGKYLLMPFLRRKVVGFESASDYYDFETAYGYGGPIVNTDDEEWIHNALNTAGRYFAEQKYLCGFVRFHPILFNAGYCSNNITVIHDRETVVIDTEKSEKEIWNTQISSKNRNTIRKAEKNGLVYEVEYDFKSLDQFIDLYNGTMKRLKAEEFYYFSQDYYKNYIRQLDEHAFLGVVKKDEKLICGALFMYSGDYGHYHLEGSDHEYASLGANNLLLWKTACVMHGIGVKQFHLGGGYNSDKENSLLKFKKAFSRDLRQFSIGKMIFDNEAYDEVRREWAQQNPEKVPIYGNRLLCYRY